MVRSNLKIEVSGPIFNGQARRDVRRLLDSLKVEVAKAGEQRLKREFGKRIKQHNTKYGVGYVDQIQHETINEYNDQIITDGGVIYGEWLERGAYTPPTRFKGYHGWRRTRQALRKWWIPVAQRRFDQLVARWNR